MVHPELQNFLIAIVGASASFIGLLFVAISIFMNDERLSKTNMMTQRILAESSYAALINIFFIGLVALIPNTTIGYVTLVMAWTGLGSTANYIRVIKNTENARHNLAILGFSITVYVLELGLGVYWILQDDHYRIGNYTFMALIIFLFSMALTRAWELTGITQARRR